MRKIILIALFLFNYVLSLETYTGAHTLVLNNDQSKIDENTLTTTPQSGVSIFDGENIIHYESEMATQTGYGSTSENEMHTKADCNKEKLVKITEPGIYIVSGTLKGQLAIDLSATSENTKIVTLVLNGVNIECSVAPGLIFYNANEIDSESYGTSQNSISYTTANGLNFDNAGAKIIIADDSTNTVTGSHVAECYEYTKNPDDSYTFGNKIKYDGAFYSKVSMSIKGETKGNGILNIIADNEGLDSEKHLLIQGGNINIASQNDGINTNEDYGSVTMIKGGTLTINGGLGEEGDGIDSNGYLIINGGTVISAAKPASDSGMDADLGVVINGGTVVGVGSTMDGASTDSSQPTMNLKFSSQVAKDSKLEVKDSSGNTLISFTPSSAGYVKNTDIRTYQGAIISLPSFELNGVYYLYLDDNQLGYSGQGGQNTPGNLPDNNGGNSGTPPDGNSGTPPDGNSGTPPDGNSGTPPDGNSGNPPENKGQNSNQSTSSASMSKEFTLSSKSTTFNGVGVYTETNSNSENSDDNGCVGLSFRYSLAFLMFLL